MPDTPGERGEPPKANHTCPGDRFDHVKRSTHPRIYRGSPGTVGRLHRGGGKGGSQISSACRLRISTPRRGISASTAAPSPTALPSSMSATPPPTSRKQPRSLAHQPWRGDAHGQQSRYRPGSGDPRRRSSRPRRSSLEATHRPSSEDAGGFLERRRRDERLGVQEAPVMPSSTGSRSPGSSYRSRGAHSSCCPRPRSSVSPLR